MNSQGAVAVILALTVLVTFMALTMGRYIFAPDAPPSSTVEAVADFFTVVISALIGALATYLGTPQKPPGSNEGGDDDGGS